MPDHSLRSVPGFCKLVAATEVFAIDVHKYKLCALSCQWSALQLTHICLLYSSRRAFGDFSVYNERRSESNANGERAQLQAIVQPTD